MAADWFCEIAGQQMGPMSAKQLRNLVDQGRLAPEHRVRQGIDGSWVPAARVKGLFADRQPRRQSTPNNGGLLMATPLDEADAPRDSGSTQATRQSVKRAVAAAAPPASSKSPAAQSPPGGRFCIVTDIDTNRAATAGSVLGIGKDRARRRRTQAFVLGSLVLLVVALAAAAAMLAVWGNPFKDRPGKSGRQSAASDPEDVGPDRSADHRPAAAGNVRRIDASKPPIQRTEPGPLSPPITVRPHDPGEDSDSDAVTRGIMELSKEDSKKQPGELAIDDAIGPIKPPRELADEDEDPDGDVAKIKRDIKEPGQSDREQAGDDNPSGAFIVPPELGTDGLRNNRDRRAGGSNR